MKKSWKRKTVAVVLGAMLLTIGVSVAATQGTEANPLVTLSYLKDVFTPTVMTKAQETVSATQAKYEKTLQDKIAAYRTEMETLLNTTAGGTSGVFVSVDLAAGKTLNVSVGSEVMLRSGDAVCSHTVNPVMMDLTDGTNLDSGKSLLKNHLYMVSMDGTVIKAGKACKLMVRGN
ncbi:MAG: hypothetical protein RR053_03970 [Evtepia sp.]